jgi:SAM-dependent methyltransferase
VTSAGWDDPATARAYEEFDRRHDRYRRANAELVAHAALEPDARVLDVGAGLGGTARAALELLGSDGSIVCYEPAAAMRSRGRELFRDPRVEWVGELPAGPFDRVLAGAALWQLSPLGTELRRLARLLREGGALVFTVPSVYLGRPDEPGGGRDPLLLGLLAALARPHGPVDGVPEDPPPLGRIDELLADAGLAGERWQFSLRLTQEAYRDWLKIPVLTGRLLAGLDADARARAVDEAYATVDHGSWRHEHWTGWTAWKGRQTGGPTLSGT